MLERQLKMLSRAVVLESYANKFAGRAFREIENSYKEMFEEIVECAVEHRASQNTLHRILYKGSRKRLPSPPTKVFKGTYKDAVRRARSFRELENRGKAYSGKQQIRRVAIISSDSQGWRIEDGAIKLRTRLDWIGLRYHQ